MYNNKYIFVIRLSLILHIMINMSIFYKLLLQLHKFLLNF